MSYFNINSQQGLSFKKVPYKRNHLLHNKVMSVLKKQSIILKLARPPSTNKIPCVDKFLK